MFRSALLILSGNATASLLLLARNLIVARLIPVADYGVAATFAIAMAVVEMASQLGLQQQIIQAKDGDDPKFQAALQGFQLLRGCLSGIALFVVAGPVAAFFGIPEAAWAYRVLAVVPVLMALTHFDIHRLTRHGRFTPMLLSAAVPAALSVLALWPLAMLFGDYQVMLWALVVHGVATVVVSHFLAERRYAISFDRTIIARSLSFGWPLLINGILLFAVFNGDRMIVGGLMGMESLAIFSMGITLTLTPTLVLGKSVQTAFLPKLSAAIANTDPQRPEMLSRLCMELVIATGLAMVMLTIFLGRPMVYLLLGEKYVALLPFIVWLALLQAVRFFKTGPSVIALAHGHTGNATLANLARVALLPVAWFVAARTGDIFTVIWLALLGEFIGHGVALTVLRLRTGVPLRPFLRSHVWSYALLAVAGVHAWAEIDNRELFAIELWLALVILALFMTSLFFMTTLRRDAIRRLTA